MSGFHAHRLCQDETDGECDVQSTAAVMRLKLCVIAAALVGLGNEMIELFSTKVEVSPPLHGKIEISVTPQYTVPA